MAKANYRKVEESLIKGLHDMKVKRLQEEAKRVATGEKAGKDEHTPKQLLTILQQDLKWMRTHHKEEFKKLKFNKKELEALREKVEKDPGKLTKEEVRALKKLKGKVSTYKKEKCPPMEDKDLILSQRKGHIYKRHNVKEKWVPLDTHSDLSDFET